MVENAYDISAKTGETWITRRGYKAGIEGTDGAGDFPLRGWIQYPDGKHAWQWTVDGYCVSKHADNDLVRRDTLACRTEANFPMRKAINRLRLVEENVGLDIPAWLKRDLAVAIQGVVDLIRKQERQD